MEQPPPSKLDYQPPGKEPLLATWFFAGLLAGVAVSCWLWIVQWNHWGQSRLLYVVLFLKVLIGTLLYQSKLRPAGVGIWCSVAIGALIWVGMCATHFEI
jgi:hypothetical protein